MNQIVPIKSVEDSFDTVVEEWKNDPDYVKEYEDLKVEFEVTRELIRARARAQLTQKEVAKKMRTTQSAIARLESGTKSINLKTLEKYAAATRTHLQIKLSAH